MKALKAVAVLCWVSVAVLWFVPVRCFPTSF
jgi:hypothetical protein